MYCLIATGISSPWWARRSAGHLRTKRGTKTQGAFVRLSPAGTPRIEQLHALARGGVRARNYGRSSTLGACTPAAPASAGRRSMPAGNAGLYSSRGVSDPGLRPAGRPRPRPQGSLTPRLPDHVSRDGCAASAVCVTGDMSRCMTRNMPLAHPPAAGSRSARHGHSEGMPNAQREE